MTNDELVERLLTDFYVSDSYDPKAERPADVVKAAIAFTLTRLRSPASEGEVEALEPFALFEMGCQWQAMLQGQTLEDSRAVGRTLSCDIFEPIAEQIDAVLKEQGFDSFASADSGIVECKAIIRAALAALPNRDDALRKALELALPIIKEERQIMIDSYTNRSGPNKGEITNKAAKYCVASMDAALAAGRAALATPIGDSPTGGA